MSKLPTPTEILGSSFRLLPQEPQLLLITSVLGTSPSWLIYSLLHNTFTNGESVLFFSFLNDCAYFRDGGKRHGLDLPTHLRKGTLTFIDGFSKLFLPPAAAATPSANPIPPTASPSRVGVIPARGGPITPRQIPPTSASTNPTDPIKYITLGPSPSPAALKQLDIIDAIKSTIRGITLSSGGGGDAKPKLVIEGLEVLLAAAGVDVGLVEDLVYDLREITSTAIILLPSDSVLIQTSPSSTPLELSHANMVISLGHMADAIISLRLLDTGVAKDISGAIKVTRGAANLGGSSSTTAAAGVVEEKEMLYYESDVGVRIFARGSGGH